MTFNSCSKDKLLTFYVNDEQDIQIDTPFSFPVNTVLPISAVPVTTNSREEFSQQNTSANLVKNVSLNKLSLTIIDPANKTFSFLKSIEIFIYTNSNDEVRLAYLDDVPASAGNAIQLQATGAKLDAYLKADTYYIRTKATIDETVDQDITIRANMRFKVTADPL